MAEHHRKQKQGDRHRNKGRVWHPDEALFEEAMTAIREGLSWTMTAYLIECLKYVVGRRKSFPPRPRWAEERAATLDDGDPMRPDEATDT